MQKLDVYLHAKPGIKTVSPVGYSPDGTVALISVVATTSPQDTKTSQLITTLRDSYIPDVTSSSHTQIYVGGQTALSNDFSNVLDSKIPLFLGSSSSSVACSSWSPSGASLSRSPRR